MVDFKSDLCSGVRFSFHGTSLSHASAAASITADIHFGNAHNTGVSLATLKAVVANGIASVEATCDSPAVVFKRFVP